MYWNNSSDDPICVTERSQAVLLDNIDQRLSENQGFSVATLNLDHTVKLRRDPAFAKAYAAHSHVTADGRPVVWLARLAGETVELVAGSDLIAPLVARAAQTGVPVGFFGSTPETLDRAAADLQRNHPGLQVAFLQSPPMGFDPTGPAADKAIRDIGSSDAKIILLALGAPKQELFAARAAMALPDKGFVSIGAGLDFIAGRQNRAPALLRRIGAEFAWRWMLQPRRMTGRYLACIAILPRLTLRALRHRWRRT